MRKNGEKGKHMTSEQRKEIELGLNAGMTFKGIAKRIGKDPTTVSYEVKHHRFVHKNGFTKTNEPCSLLLKAPFVCNGCSKRSNAGCRCVRYLYLADRAQAEYRGLLSEAREGIPLTKEQFYIEDKIITEALAKGQHIYHIMASSPQIHSSKSTVYRHFRKGYYSASVLDLPRAVKYKPRKSKPVDYVPKGLRVGRSYDDFCLLRDAEKMHSWVELDTVIGRAGGKVILTIHFTLCNFMAGLLLDNRTAMEAADHFRGMKDRLRTAGFRISDVMPVVLTDNGGEFSDVFSFEQHHGEKELSLFYCDPMCSWQKPQIEKNHTLFRDIVPKGSSFDDFSQETVDLIFSHVNSVRRALFNGKSAYEMFCFFFSDALAAALGIVPIPDFKVVQSPKLLDGLADLTKNVR